MQFSDGLLESLHEGMFEAPLWDGFLRRLQAASGAALTLAAIRPAGQDAFVDLAAGEGPAGAIRGLLSGAQMREARIYGLDELAPSDQAGPLRGDLRTAGIVNLQAVRLTEPGGTEAWLACAGGRILGAATGALLLALAPHMRIALRNYAALERERFRSAVTGEAFSRLKIGWMTLDQHGRIIEATDDIEQMFRWGSILRRGRYDRLVPASPAIDRQIMAFLKQIAAGEELRPMACNLSQDPWVDMLVAPLQGDAIPAHSNAAAIVYVSGDRSSQADRCEQLVDLFGLLPSEARLAWLLAQATSIAEGAEALGLTTETARNYSKKIYAKTGAKGHADLVRIVMTSVLALS